MANSNFTVQDLTRLEKTITIRERLIDQICGQEQLPTGAKDVEAFTNLLESVDRSIFARVKIDIDSAQQRVNEETKEVLKDLMLSLHQGGGRLTIESTAREIPTYKATGMEISEGELIAKIDVPNMEQFLGDVAA